MGREDLIGDDRFSTPAARTEHRAEVDRIVSEWTIRHDKHTAMQLVGSATIPAGAVLDTRELADDPTFAERGIRQTMKHPQVGEYVMSGWPVRFGGQTPPVGPAPLLGQHGEQVLSEWLNYDTARITDLKNNEVIT
jgi:formyl-CoA transferase